MGGGLGQHPPLIPCFERQNAFGAVPLPGQPKHDLLMRELRAVFDQHQADRAVRIEYETEVYWSRVWRVPPGPAAPGASPLH